MVCDPSDTLPRGEGKAFPRMARAVELGRAHALLLSPASQSPPVMFIKPIEEGKRIDIPFAAEVINESVALTS